MKRRHRVVTVACQAALSKVRLRDL